MKYFLFRFLAIFPLIMLKQNFRLKLKDKLIIFKKKILKNSSFLVYFFMSLFVWIALIEVRYVLLITNILIVLKSKYFYAIIGNMIKGYPIRKLHYKSTLLFFIFILLLLLRKPLFYQSILFLILTGFIFYLRDDLTCKNFKVLDLLLLNHLSFLVLSGFFGFNLLISDEEAV